MLQPYVYQNEAIDAVCVARSRGSRSSLVVMASGLGKTATVAFLTKRWRRKRERVLYLCHQNEILEQARETFEKILGTKDRYGFLNGYKKSLAGTEYLFASFQSMRNVLHLFAKDDFDYIYVDESHHSYADTHKDVIEYFEPKFLLGFTATPNRMDEKDIREIYGKPVYSLSLPEALARGLLAPVDYRLLSDELQLKKVIDVPERKLSVKLLNKKIFVPKRDEEIVSIVRRHAAELKNPRTIIFCSSKAHCDHFGSIMEDAVAIHSGISRAERKVRMELFRQGLVSTVLAVDVFNEGVDVPEANLLVFLRSTNSRTIFFQQLGRGLRRSVGKENVRVLDFVGNCERVRMIIELYDEVRREQVAQRPEIDWTNIEAFKLNVDTVEFVERVVPLLELLGRMSAAFYPTWQEASAVSKKLKISSQKEYFADGYLKDARLPSNPRQFYPDFPGWAVFLGNDHYPSWQEASSVAISLGFKTPEEYRKGYNQDVRLPSSPNKSYPDFPGWRVFLGKGARDYYSTWNEASQAAQMLGIRTQKEYYARRSEDPRLNSSPHRFYSDFPGYKKFLGTDEAAP